MYNIYEKEEGKQLIQMDLKVTVFLFCISLILPVVFISHLAKKQLWTDEENIPVRCDSECIIIQLYVQI